MSFMWRPALSLPKGPKGIPDTEKYRNILSFVALA
jgi:hypothetical protein